MTWGSTPFRDKKWEANPSSLRLLLKHLSIPELRLCGGEPTAMPLQKLERMIEDCWLNHTPVSLITNGYGVMKMTPEVLQKLKYIILDDHGVNHNHVEDCCVFCKNLGIEAGILKRYKHDNIWAAAQHPENKGKSCDCWLRLPVVYDGVIYPCCTMPYHNYGRRDTWYALKEAGWSIWNPNLREILDDIEDIPKLVIKSCLYECYGPNSNLGGIVDVTHQTGVRVKR